MSQKRLEMMLQFFNVSLSSILFNSLVEGIFFYIFNVLKCNKFLCTGYFCSGFLSWSIMLLVFQLFLLAQNLVRLSFCSCYFWCSGVLYFTRNIVTVAAYIYHSVISICFSWEAILGNAHNVLIDVISHAWFFFFLFSIIFSRSSGW